jgi:hypothetical protein
MTISIEELTRRGVYLWAYARSQPALERMIQQAQFLKNRPEFSVNSEQGAMHSTREKVAQWDWEMRSQLCLLFRPPEPLLEAFRQFPMPQSQSQNSPQEIDSLRQFVEFRLEVLLSLLRCIDQFSTAKLRHGRRVAIAAPEPYGRLMDEPLA